MTRTRQPLTIEYIVVYSGARVTKPQAVGLGVFFQGGTHLASPMVYSKGSSLRNQPTEIQRCTRGAQTRLTVNDSFTRGSS